MEGRCAVDTWADFGCSGSSRTPRLRCGFGPDVFLCTGDDQVYVFSSQERKLTAVIECPGPVTDLLQSHDQQFLYVACSSGVYCVGSQFLSSRAPSSPAAASSSPAELKMPAEFLAVPEEGVLSLLLVGSLLLTLSQRDASWILTLYRSSNYEMLRSLSRPLVSTGTRRRPLLICVHSGAVAAAPPPPSTPEVSGGDHLCLEPVLFTLLFGIDAALAKSPVVLCGLPDGCLCFLPLRPPAPRLKVLHSLEQPVAFIGASGGATDAGPGHARCLVAVGERGRVVLIKSEKGGGGNRSVFIERCVQGPVVCGCADATRLYYSTGSDLLALDLSEVSPERDGHVETSGAALRSPASLNVCRVAALAEPTRNTAGEVELLGLSVRGQLQRITVPVEREDAGLPGGPPTRGGRGVRDLLSAIGDVCERASVLKTAIKSQNQILRRLNQALNVSFLLLAGGTNTGERLPGQEKPIRCRAAAGWSRLLRRDSLNLTCVLENWSPYALERGWTLSVAVLPLSRPPGSSSSSASFPLRGLPPGGAFEASLPLAAAGEAAFPVTVSCSLVFSLGGLPGEDAERLPGVGLPLSALTVDWLHGLQACGPIGARGKAATPQRRNATDAVDAFLRARRVSRGGGGEEGERGRHSASVRVSSELLRDALAAKGSDGDALSVFLCPSLLEWLLAAAPGGVAAARRGGHGGSVVRGHDPNGDAVQLTAKEVNVGEESTAEGEEPLSAVEVLVESSSLAAVCGLHHALLRRIQALLHTAPERAASPKRIQSLGLREALQRAERLLQQIRQSRISGAFGGGVSTGLMTQSLLSVYQELRENPLLIM